MKDPGGHYLDNLLETFFFFQKDFNIYAVLNRIFDDKGTFIPNGLFIHKILKRNNFEKKRKQTFLLSI